MSGEDPESGWWLGSKEPGHIVNRRWRTSHPGDLHPMRRSTDRAERHVAPRPDPFDPATLFAPSGPTVAHGPADDAPTTDDDPVPPWSTLDLTSSATWSEVVARQRELAMEHHPDRQAGDELAARRAADRMVEINAAVAELARIYRITGDR